MEYTDASLTEITAKVRQDVDDFCLKLYAQDRRTHLGASEVGDECLRRQWYLFRWIRTKTFPARMYRLFNRGHREEERIIEWLKGVGFHILELNPQTSKQWLFAKFGGHYGGSTDGLATHPIYFPDHRLVLEFKTHNAKSFAKLRKEGVKQSKPKHYAQMCVYGREFDCGLGLYAASNKDDDDLHIEIVWINNEVGRNLEDRAKYIITATEEPSKMQGANPSHYICKTCESLGVCFYKEPADKNCRSCKNAVPVEGGWFCQHFKGMIPKDFVVKGCELHETILKH